MKILRCHVLEVLCQSFLGGCQSFCIKILYDFLQYLTVWWVFCRDPGMKVVYSFLRRSPVEILVGSSKRRPCMLWYISFGEDLVKVLATEWNAAKRHQHDLVQVLLETLKEMNALRFWRCFALIGGPSVTSLRCPAMRFWYEVLVGRHVASELVRVASCAEASSCCCRYDTV